MKNRKLILVLGAVCCLAVFLPLQVQSATWYPAGVVAVGPYGLTEGTSGTDIYLTSYSDPPAWQGSKKFKISPDRSKEFLAVALAALMNQKQVSVYCTLGAGVPKITGIYVWNPQ